MLSTEGSRTEATAVGRHSDGRGEISPRHWCDIAAGKDTMRIAVIGAGGVGGPFGAALAKAGGDVTFVARGAHLAAMRARGLSVLGPRGDIHLSSVQATDEPADIGPVDFVLFCVKLWDVEGAGAAIRPLVGADTAVIPLQNGIDASERLIPILGKDAVMGGVAQISGTIAEPGVIHQTGTFMRLAFGELDGRGGLRGAAFHSLCQGAGFDSVNSNHILTALWEKFVLLATNSSVVALTRLPFGKLRDDPEVFALFERAVAEVAGVGRARGVDLPTDLEVKTLQATRNFPAEMLPSMAVDLLRGNRLELPWLAGKVVALGRELGVPTPTFDVMYAALKPYANGAPA
jgi:2-dehydropantoate 2-reductase